MKGRTMSASGSKSGTWRSNRRREVPSNDTRPERAIWKGAISFGLVQIPVSLVAAERPNELAFHQLDRRDHAPIGYQRINKHTGKKVDWADIVRGYEISKGSFVIITDDDFAKVNVEASQTIDILEFVDAPSIPLAYFERPYYLLPDGRSRKAYAVLRDALAGKNLVAIALVVIRTRQHLAAVIPSGDRLELELLRFPHELRAAPTLGEAASLRAGRATPKETALAEQLIDAMVAPWDPSKYKDTYRDQLLAAIHEKAKTGTIEAQNVPSRRGATVTDLLSLLQKSVRQKNAPRAAPRAQKARAKRKAA